jgi:hypothetical protein
LISGIEKLFHRGTGLFDSYGQLVKRHILSCVQALYLAIDFKSQYCEALVAISNGMIFYDVTEVGDSAGFRGREADNAEVTSVDRLYDRVDCNPLFFVQRKLNLSCG